MANYKTTLLTSEDYVKENSYISDNIDSKFLLSAIYKAQEINLPTVLFSKALYRRLQVLVYEGTINDSENEAYKELLDEVQNYLVSKTLYNIYPMVNNKTSNFGTYSSDDERLTAKSDIKPIMDNLLNEADYYSNSIQEYLIINKDKFVELNGKCLQAAKSSASTGLWLGGTRGQGASSMRPIENIIINSVNGKPEESVSETYTENGTYEIKPSAGYTMSDVAVTVNVPQDGSYDEGYNDGYSKGTEDGYADGKSDGITEGKEAGIEEQKSKLSTLNVTENGTYTNEDGYNEVNVNVEGGSTEDIELQYFASSASYNPRMEILNDTEGAVRVDLGFARDKNGKDYTVQGGTSEMVFYIGENNNVEVTSNGTTTINPSLNKTNVVVNVPQDTKKIDYIVAGKSTGQEITDFTFFDSYEPQEARLQSKGQAVYTDGTSSDYEDVEINWFVGENETVNVTENGTIEVAPSINKTPINVNVEASLDGSKVTKVFTQTDSDGDDSGKLSYDNANNEVWITESTSSDNTYGTVTYNGTDYGAENAEVQMLFRGIPTETQSITSNGTYTVNPKLAKTEITVNVPNIITVGNGLYSNLIDELGYTEAVTSALNEKMLSDIEYSKTFDSFSAMAEDARLVYAPYFDTSGRTSMREAFGGCKVLKTVPLYDTSNVTSMSLMFRNCDSLEYVPAFNTSSLTNGSKMFYGCYSLKSVAKMDFSNNVAWPFGTSTSYPYPYLTDLGGFTGYVGAVYINNMPSLTHTSIMNVINELGLSKYSESITLTSAQYATLSSTERAVATDKGWTFNVSD